MTIFRLSLCVAAALALVGCGCQPTVKKTTYDDLKNQFDKCQARVTELEGKNMGLKNQVIDLRAQLGKKESGPDITDIRDAVGGDGTVVNRYGRPTVVMESDLLFASGKATLTTRAKSALQRLATLLKRKYPQAEIAVAGHTDNDPIKRTKKTYQDNWELSSARALNVVRYMTSLGIQPGRIHGQAYGEYRPVASNGSRAGKAKNRRVEIMLMGIE